MSNEELTITKYLQLNWNDHKVPDKYEKKNIKKFEHGWELKTRDLKACGFTDLLFNPSDLELS